MKFDNAETKQGKLEKTLSCLIIPYIRKILGSVPYELPEVLLNQCRLTAVISGQYIEEAGGYEEGRLLFLESGIAQCIYYDEEARTYITTHISKKYEVIIDTYSYINQSDRKLSVQMLEDGAVFSISFPRLKVLLRNFPILHVLLWHFQAIKEQQHIYFQRLLKKMLDERVAGFLDENPGIASRINHDCLALYLGTCRTSFSTSYAKYKKLRGIK